MSGDCFLKKTQELNEGIIQELRVELGTEKALFERFILDYIVIQLYAEFESDFNNIIQNAIGATNLFSQGYIDFLLHKDKKLHRGLKKEPMKDFLTIVLKEKEVESFFGSRWNIYSNFVSFRHTVAHDCDEESYTRKKDILILNMGNIQTLISELQAMLVTLKNACEEIGNAS